jgi:hypothetical protein
MSAEGDDGEIDAADTRHGRLFVVGDCAGAVAEHDAETVIERDQEGDRAFADDARPVVPRADVASSAVASMGIRIDRGPDDLRRAAIASL